MTKKVDKNANFMRQMWGTEFLSSEYGWDATSKEEKNQKMLREISNDDITPKKHDFYLQNELHSKIRNDNDYDDWEYGTEPLYESKNHNK
jgi:hypothetical protein